MLRWPFPVGGRFKVTFAVYACQDILLMCDQSAAGQKANEVEFKGQIKQGFVIN
jgi:hypothetical protein